MKISLDGYENMQVADRTGLFLPYSIAASANVGDVKRMARVCRAALLMGGKTEELDKALKDLQDYKGGE